MSETYDPTTRTWFPTDKVLTRRRLLRATVGVGALAAPTFLRHRAAAQGTPSVGTDLAAYQAAAVDWRQAAGQTLVLGGVEHPWMTAVGPLLPQFMELTGVEVVPQTASEAEYGADLPITLSGGSATPDIFMVPALGQAVDGGWLEPLDGYYANPALTDPAWYDEADVFQSARDFPVWPADGSRYSVSITAESQTLFLRRDLFEAKGITAPTTMDELYAAAEALKADGMAGAVMRAKPTSGSAAWTAGGFVFSFGGEVIDSEGRAAFDREPAVAAIDLYGRLLKDTGPAGVGNYDWYESLQDFQQGRAAIAGDSSNFTLDIENPEKSTVVGQVLYGAMPSGNGAPPKPNMWHWQLGMNRNSAAKNAAWLFMTWATSAPTGLLLARDRAAVARASAWQDPRFRTEVFGEQAAEAALANLQAADAAVMTRAWFHPRWPQVGDLFAVAVNEVVIGARDAESALTEAAQQANRILEG
jgi:multiple sugar transport system substrate-binding protein